jgi:hypothetical protein
VLDVRNPCLIGRGFSVLQLLSLRALRAADGLDFFHPPLHGGFRKIGALLELLEHARTLVFLLEALDGAIDGLIISDHDANQTKSPPLTGCRRAAVPMRCCLALR